MAAAVSRRVIFFVTIPSMSGASIGWLGDAEKNAQETDEHEFIQNLAPKEYARAQGISHRSKGW